MIQSIVNPDSFQEKIVEGNLPDRNCENTTVPVIVNRKSPYYQELGKKLHVGDSLSGTVDTGFSDIPVTFSVTGFVEDQDTGVVLYTNGEVLDKISEMNCTLTWYICLTDDGSKTDTIREIKEMTNQDNRLYVSVLAEDISSLENYFHNATVIVMVLTVLVSLFSFINLLNTSITNVNIITKANAKVQIIAIIALFINDLFSFIP